MRLHRTSPKTHDLFVRRWTDRAVGQDYVDWAISMLEEGKDSPNLRMLAGLTDTSDEASVERYFCRCLSDLGLVAPEREAGLRHYLRLTCSRIADDSLTPHEGLGEIYWISQAVGDPPEFRRWFYLDWGVDPDTMRQMTGPEAEEAVRNEAGRILEQWEQEKYPQTDSINGCDVCGEPYEVEGEGVIATLYCPNEHREFWVHFTPKIEEVPDESTMIVLEPIDHPTQDQLLGIRALLSEYYWLRLWPELSGLNLLALRRALLGEAGPLVAHDVPARLASEISRRLEEVRVPHRVEYNSER